MHAVEHDIRNFIVENFLYGEENAPFSNDDSFVDHGIVDSTGVLELVMFIETTYGIEIKDEELVPTNLDTVNNLMRFLGGKVPVSNS